MDKSFTAIAIAGGTATVDITPVPGGLQWIVWQFTVETIPVRGAAQATVRRNGRYLTSTIVGSSSSAQGPPSLQLAPSDELTCTWVGLTVGDEAILTLFYEETEMGGHGSGFGIV